VNLFYTKPEHVSHSRLLLEGQEARHAVKVLRHREGDTIHVTNGKGTRYEGKIDSISKSQVSVSIEGQEYQPAPEPQIILAVGLIKKRDRLEFAVEKAAELGAARIIVFTGERSEKTGVRMDRLEMTALSAMKQSLRLWLPGVFHFQSLGEVMEMNQTNRIGVADESMREESGTNTVRVLQKFHNGSSTIIIGPEGGFSESERELMDAEQVFPFSLGPYRLRTETAVTAVMSRLMAWEEE